MKITAANAEDAIKQGKAAPLKGLTGADFGQQLDAQLEGSSSPAAPTRALRPMTEIDMIPGIKGPVKPLSELNPPAKPLDPLGDAPFSMGRPKAAKTEHQKVEEQARKWLAQTFYGPMLKQMRESPFKSEMFSGGRGGQAFSSMLDQRLADHMSRSTSSKLVQSIARKLEARKGYAAQAAPAAVTKPAAASDNTFQNVRIHVAPNLRA